MTFIPAGGGTYTLATSISSTDTTIILSSFTEPVSGTPYTMVLLGTDIVYGTIAPRTTQSEFISFTGITQNADGTATLTGVTRGLAKKTPFTSNATYKLPHAGQSVFIMSDVPQLFNEYLVNENTETITGAKTFSVTPVNNGGNPVNPTDLATKAYVDLTATGGATTNKIIVAGNAGETVAAGNLLYLNAPDGEWYLCDADTAATIDNIILGIAQGAGTNGNPITSGVLTYGLDTTQTGLTANAVYYASNTAGAISSIPGTVEVTIGVSRSTTSVFFNPRYNQQITENQQDALAGTSGTPSSSNKFVTNDDTATSGADKVLRLNGAGALPALDASNLTGIASPKVTTSVSNVTTTSTTGEQTLVSFSIPANTLSTSNAIMVKMALSSFKLPASGINSQTFRLKYGATTIATLALSETLVSDLDGSGTIEAILVAAGGTSSQEGSIDVRAGTLDASGPKVISTAVGTAAEDSTLSKNFIITVENSASSAALGLVMNHYVMYKIY